MTGLSRSILFVFVVLSVAALAQVPPGLNPIEKNVDCDKPNASITNTIDNLEPYKNYIIHVSGTCNENVGIFHFEGRFLGLDGGGTAVINNAQPGSTVNINNSRRVVLNGFTINNDATGPAAVSFGNCRNCALNNSTITGVLRGVVFNGTEGGVSNTTVQLSDPGAFNAGINVQNLSGIGLNGVTVQTSVVPRNGLGIQAGTGSVVNVNPGPDGSLVEGFRNGVFVDSGAAIFVNGGGALGPGVTIQNNNVGVSVNSARAIVRNPGALITLNIDGLNASFNSDVVVQNGARIVANTGNGVILTFSSTAQFQGVAPVDLTLNTGSDLFCGTHSFAVGGGNLVAGFDNDCGPAGANLDPAPIP